MESERERERERYSWDLGFAPTYLIFFLLERRKKVEDISYGEKRGPLSLSLPTLCLHFALKIKTSLEPKRVKRGR